MNTTHNKDLVIDQGWVTTIQNALSLPVTFNMKRSNRNVKQNQCLQKSNKESTEKVFTISNSLEHCEGKSACSHETQKQQLDSDKSQVPNLIRSCSTETTFSENLRLKQGNHLYFGEQILQRMMNTIEVESSYLHYFRELLRLEEMLKIDGKTEEEFEVQELNQLQKVKFEKAKCSKFIYKNISSDVRYKNNFVYHRSKNSKHGQMDHMTNLMYSKSKRIKLRQQTLSNFHLLCTTEETYSDFLNILINLEEHFIV